MNTSGLVDIMLCVRDAYGNIYNSIQNIYIEIPNFITLEGAARFKVNKSGFEIDQISVPYHNYNTMVGNIFWDCAWTSREFASMLLNELVLTKNWQIIDGQSKFWEKWKTGKEFTVEDFR